MATKLSVYQSALRLFGDARLDLIFDDTESRYAMDDAWDGVVDFCLRAAFWRFALTLTPLTPGPPSIPGFAITYPRPGDWLRTQSLFVMAGSRELPVDIREYGTTYYSNEQNVLIRYISSLPAYKDPGIWPEHFTKAVEAYLAFQVADRLTNSAVAGARISQIFGTVMQEAVLHDAQPEDPWLKYQLDGSMRRGMQFVLAQGYWVYALKTVEFTAAPITFPPPTTPLIGYPYSYPRPDDMLISHAIYVPAGDGREYPIDFKETIDQWSTAAPYFATRYVSADQGLDPTLIPETFWMALRAYLEEGIAENQPRAPGQPPVGSKFAATLAAGLAIDGEAENPWYRFQRNGAFLRACFHVAETGRWKFAINTLRLTADATISGDRLQGTLPANVYGDGSISPSYSAVFAKPADWLKTIWVYRIEQNAPFSADLEGWPERFMVDYRDELGNWHANWSHIEVRYIRRAAIESWRWPQSYADAVLSWLEYEELRLDPKQVAAAAGKLKIFQDAIERATKSDDMQEFPPYRRIGHLVRGRFYRSRGTGAQDFLGPR